MQQGRKSGGLARDEAGEEGKAVIEKEDVKECVGRFSGRQECCPQSRGYRLLSVGWLCARNQAELVPEFAPMKQVILFSFYKLLFE